MGAHTSLGVSIACTDTLLAALLLAIIVLAGPCVHVHGLKGHIGFVNHVS